MSKLILISGGSCSGKTTFAKKICDKLNENNISCNIIKMDSYYKDYPNQDLEWKLSNIDYDNPETCDINLLYFQLVNLVLKNKIIKSPIYDFKESKRSSFTNVIRPTEYVILEGIWSMYFSNILEMATYKFFVMVDESYRYDRKYKRDIEQRGRDANYVRHQWFNNVKPGHDKFVEYQKTLSDLIIPKGGDNIIGLEAVVRILMKGEEHES